MKVQVDDLKGLPHHRLDFVFREELRETQAIKPAVGELSVVWSASGVRVEGQVKTLLKLNCDRCLNPYFQSLTVDIDERFVSTAFLGRDYDKAEKNEKHDGELLHDDFVEPLPDDGVLDITDVVYQAVTLATPTYCSCGEQCPGPPGRATDGASGGKLAAKSGAGSSKSDDRPIDPRWKNLKTLFPNEDSKENS
ncbi:MAG TPA: DUF177 domain-containing protein [Drouetiella sp.]